MRPVVRRRHFPRTQLILDALGRAPMTNADLQDLLETHSGDVARIMAKLRARGLVGRQLIAQRRAIYYRLPQSSGAGPGPRQKMPGRGSAR